MSFQKGNKLGGRKVGSLSSKTKQWEELSQFILEGGSDKLIQELMKLEGKDYVQAFSSLLGYFKPRLKQVEQTGDAQTEPKVITIIKTFDKDENVKDGYTIEAKK